MKSENFLLGEQIGQKMIGETIDEKPLTEADDDVFSAEEKQLAANILNEAVERKADSREIFALGVAFGRSGTKLLTEQADDDETIPLLLEQKGRREGSFSARKRAVDVEIKEQYGPSARVVTTFPESVLFECDGRHFKAGYKYDRGSAQLGEAAKLDGTLNQVCEALNKERKATLRNLRVAGVNRVIKIPASPKPISELTESEKFNLKVAGLL